MGHSVTFKWEWLKLEKFSQRLLALYVLILPELQAFFGLMVPVSVMMFFLVKFPLWLAMLTFLPLCCLDGCLHRPGWAARVFESAQAPVELA